MKSLFDCINESFLYKYITFEADKRDDNLLDQIVNVLLKNGRVEVSKKRNANFVGTTFKDWLWSGVQHLEKNYHISFAKELDGLEEKYEIKIAKK